MPLQLSPSLLCSNAPQPQLQHAVPSHISIYCAIKCWRCRSVSPWCSRCRSTIRSWKGAKCRRQVSQTV
eukprot:5967416-Amphidinium_carterae.1